MRDREAWCAAVMGSKSVRHNWATELNWYRWGNRGQTPVFWGWKNSHTLLVCRDGWENLSQTHWNGAHNTKSESESGSVVSNWLSRVQLFATPWTVQSTEFSRPEYWSGQPFPSPGDPPNSGIKPRSLALQADSLPAEPHLMRWKTLQKASSTLFPCL